MSKNGIDRRHCKWPLGTEVKVLTVTGYLTGKINRHTQENPNECGVCFDEVVDMGTLNGVRYCHPVPFSCIKSVNRVKLKLPWYKDYPYNLVK